MFCAFPPCFSSSSTNPFRCFASAQSFRALSRQDRRSPRSFYPIFFSCFRSQPRIRNAQRICECASYPFPPPARLGPDIFVIHFSNSRLISVTPTCNQEQHRSRAVSPFIVVKDQVRPADGRNHQHHLCSPYVSPTACPLHMLLFFFENLLSFSLLAHSPLQKQSNAKPVFVVIMSSVLSYFYLRKRRERKKRDEHRWKVWQFKDMQRGNGPPPLPQSQRFQSSEIMLVPSRVPTTTEKQMSEAPARGLRYPVKIYGAGGFYGV